MLCSSGRVKPHHAPHHRIAFRRTFSHFYRAKIGNNYVTSSSERDIRASLRYIHAQTRIRPGIGVILGSGLGNFGSEIKNPCSIPADEIPSYPKSTISGHMGNLLFGKLEGVSIALFQGRTHFYESASLEDTLYPIIIAKKLGVRILIITNAAGGIDPSFVPGDLMLIADHINFTFQNVKSSPPQLFRHRDYYDADLRSLALSVAGKERIPVREGIYCGISGPSYETIAEVKMLRNFGSDAVGMSTVNEVVCANNLGMRVLGISCITNLSSGLSPHKLSHEEVTSAAAVAQKPFNRLIRSIVIAINRAHKL